MRFSYPPNWILRENNGSFNRAADGIISISSGVDSRSGYKVPPFMLVAECSPDFRLDLYKKGLAGDYNNPLQNFGQSQLETAISQSLQGQVTVVEAPHIIIILYMARTP